MTFAALASSLARTFAFAAMLASTAIATSWAQASPGAQREAKPQQPPQAATTTAGSDSDLIDITTLIPDAVIAMRYATADNFVGATMYPANVCVLRRAVVKRLAKAANALRENKRRLWLWDCYRPASIQAKFWKKVPDRRYVAKPTFDKRGKPVSGSRHSRGAAIDVGLADLDGNLLAMPSEHDDFSTKAHRNKAKKHPNAAEFLVLDRALTAAGFVGVATEWWHYDAPKAESYPLADSPLPVAGGE